jgi:predicted dienelactone hydrolase
VAQGAPLIRTAGPIRGGPPILIARLLVVIALCLTAAFAQAAGFRFIEVPADADGPSLTGAMWYPCADPPGEIHLGPLTLPGVRDCPISGDKLPLVVVSHGDGGQWWGQHDTAETLADAGFVVAAINHPGDSFGDMSRSGDLAEFVERPTDIKRLIDLMLGASPAASKIDPERIGVFWVSAGGYTALVLIGANPDWLGATEFCQHSSLPRCEQIRRKEFPVQPVVHDPRIKTAVLADPGTVFFSAGSFAGVKVPVQLWASERGNPFVTPASVAALDRNLPAKHEYRVVPNAWHEDFWLCPAFLKELPDCKDAPDFDRVAFHKQFNAAVLAFFRTHLVKTP